MAATAKPRQPDWVSRLPVEIWNTITRFLPRSTVKNLRLVCKQIENKVASNYFQTVVVPFRPELLGSVDAYYELRVGDDQINMFVNGRRVLEQFGPHIKKFALYLELDESLLAFPPLKCSQKAVTTYWGIYRWPNESYSRFSELAGLEQTADETSSMRLALGLLENVYEIGLSCDPGLGYLHGPDVNVLFPPQSPTVFNSRRFAPEPNSQSDTTSQHDPVTGNTKSVKYQFLEQMVKEAGYAPDQSADAIELILQAEGRSLQSIMVDEPVAIACPHMFGVDGLSPKRNPYLGVFTPKHLSEAQKEVLLEMEWAHRALVQSYVISVMDNGPILGNITTLTIATLMASHVPILQRRDLWYKLEGLRSVSLGIIPDWRSINKTAAGNIDDVRISPTDAIPKVYELLSKYIGPCPNIKKLHFEWICGGEFASGISQRNRYVLPAPFTEAETAMVDPYVTKRPESSRQLLSLPNVEELSLKNCWSSPHVFLRVIRGMGLRKLANLTLESVSLSGCPTTQDQPPFNPIVAATNHAFWQQNQGPIGVNPSIPMEALAEKVAALSDALPAPRRAPKLHCLSWSYIIDELTPNTGHVDCPVWESTDPGIDKEEEQETRRVAHLFVDGPFQRQPLRINRLEFKSCGYVFVENNRTLNAPLASPFFGSYNNTDISGKLKDLEEVMLTSTSPLLGKITNWLTYEDTNPMVKVHLFSFDWQNHYSEDIINSARADGIDFPGRGRFSGVVQRGVENWA